MAAIGAQEQTRMCTPVVKHHRPTTADWRLLLRQCGAVSGVLVMMVPTLFVCVGTAQCARRCGDSAVLAACQSAGGQGEATFDNIEQRT